MPNKTMYMWGQRDNQRSNTGEQIFHIFVAKLRTTRVFSKKKNKGKTTTGQRRANSLKMLRTGLALTTQNVHKQHRIVSNGVHCSQYSTRQDLMIPVPELAHSNDCKSRPRQQLNRSYPQNG